MLATFTVINTAGDTSAGSLYDAVVKSNSTPATPGAPNRIDFNLVGNGVQTISLVQALPAITQPVVIDGTSTGQGSVYQGSPLVAVDGTKVAGADGFNIAAPGVTLQGLAIEHFTGFTYDGVRITSATNTAGTGDQVIACFIGTDPTGTTAAGNNDAGVDIDGSSYNTVGVPTITVAGKTFSGGNVISGNGTGGISGWGILIQNQGAAPAGHNVIQSNLIGVSASGAGVLGNGREGMYLQGATSNTIGGTAAGAGNVIAGNVASQIKITDQFGTASTNNLVEGNLIGTNKAGTAALSNASGSWGVEITGAATVTGNTIGGTTAAARNVISGNNAGGVHLNDPGNLVIGNTIGLNQAGNGAVANRGPGVYVDNVANSTVGGVTAAPGTAPGNVISGNLGDGISVTGSSGGTLIAGNLIGTDPAGGAAFPNSGDGVFVASAPVTIGGTAAGARNVIAGNTGYGVTLSTGATALVEGNLIGLVTGPNGATALGNQAGVWISGGANNTIGGVTAAPGTAPGNVISGNRNQGIYISFSAGNNLIEGNLIGTDPAGTVAVPNSGAGVYDFGSVNDRIGGLTSTPGTGPGNVIAGNGNNGVLIGNSSTTFADALIQGNRIGTDVNGSPLGNQGDGVRLNSSGNTVGGTAAGAANVIANSQANTTTGAAGAGVQLVLNANQNSILGNAISNNQGLGISLVAGKGPTPNHPNELLNGKSIGPTNPAPNNFQNYPVLSSVLTTGGATTINGTLNALPNQTYLIQYFSNPTPDTSGYGEGQTFLGSQSVTTDATGNVMLPPFTPAGGAVSVGSSVTATATDASGNTSEFAQDVPAQGMTDLSISGTSSAPVGGVFVGQPVTYTFTVTNTSTTDVAHSVTVSDILPSGVQNVTTAVTPNVGTVTQNGNTLTFNLGNIPAAAANSTANVVTVSVTVTPTVANVGTLSDTATVATTDFDPNTQNNTTTVNAGVNPVVDLGVTLTTSTPPPGSVPVGQNVTYTIKITNSSSSPATAVVLTDTLDPNETFVSATLQPPSGSAVPVTAPATGPVTANLATLAAGATATLTVVTTPTAGAINAATDTGQLTDTASVAYAQSMSDPTPQDNTATAQTDVSPVANLQVSFNPAPGPVSVGSPLTYTVVVKNTGPSTANNVQFTDTLDPNVTFDAMDSDARLSQAGTALTANLGALNASDSTILTIVVTPQDKAGQAGSVANTAGVFASEPPYSSAASALSTSNTTTVTPNAVLTLQGALSTAAPLYAGMPSTFTFTVTNTGPSTAHDVTVTDPLPATLLTFVPAQSTSSQGQKPVYSTATGSATTNLGTLAPNQKATVTIVVTPTAAAAGTSGFTNTASVAADESPSSTTAVTSNAVAAAPILPTADVGITVSAAPNPVPVAGPNSTGGLTYTVKVINNGPSTATNIGVVDNLDPTVTFASGFWATSSGGETPLSAPAPGSGQVTATIPSLASGDTATLTIVVTPNVAGTVNNAAAITGSTPVDLVPGNNTAQAAPVRVGPTADISANLAASASQVTVNTPLIYTAAVTNTGPSTATGAVITVTLPAGVTVNQVVTSAGGAENLPRTGNTITVSFPSLPSQGVGTVTIVATPNVTGPLTATATAAASELDPNPANNAARPVSISVVPPPGTFQFSAPVYTFNDNSGFATIIVTRANGAQGDVQVHYGTTAGSAVPGLDFAPVSGTLDFPQGVTTQTFTVPLLNYPFNRADKAVGLALDSPTNGAVLGPQAVSALVVHVTNPDVIAPQVTSMTWAGYGTTIGAITLQFSKELNPATAMNPNNYHIVDVGADTVFGTPDDTPVPLNPVTPLIYNPFTFTVTLFPAFPLRPNEFYHIDVNGTQAGAVADSAGNLLSGNGSGLAGSDYQTYFGRGTNLNYVDATGNLVSLSLTGGGVLDLSRFPNGQGNVLQVINPVPGRSTLRGTVRGGGRFAGTGATSLTAMEGLGRFGDVRVLLRTPPFYATNLPYSGRLIAPPATNTVLGAVVPQAPQVRRASTPARVRRR